MHPENITQQVTIKKLYHKGSWHIGLYFEYDTELIKRIKQLPNRRYTKTHNCWYIPYTQASYNLLQQSNIPYRIDVPIDTRQAVLQSDTVDIDSTKESKPPAEEEKDSGNLPTDINPNVYDKQGLHNIIYNSGAFFITINYSNNEVAFLKSLDKSYWSKKDKSWISKGTIDNLKALQSRYHYWTNHQYDLIADQIKVSPRRKRAKLQMTPDHPGHYSLKFRGNITHPTWLKTESKRQYDKVNKTWLLVNDDNSKQRIIERLASDGYDIMDYTTSGYDDVQYTRDWVKKKKYLLRHCPQQHISYLDSFVSMMIRERYSWNTIKQYCSVLLRYMIYSEEQNVDPHLQSTIVNYISDIAESNVSYQEINRHQSTLRLYFTKLVSDSNIDFKIIPRPRRPKSLPKVMSKGEVIQLFAQIKNSKHLVMLYLAYGSGLRSGEIINLKIHDLDFENQRIWVRSGKGNKDRLVPMPQSIVAMIRTYLLEHKPSYWLFEGQKPSQPYSASSLSLVYRRARTKTSLAKHYTLHSLRHSFATHLMDSGTDLRLIKELLGHKDIKTTLIYTHITDKTIRRVLSPLDILLNKSDQNDSF